MLPMLVLCLAVVALGSAADTTHDPLYGGIFTTAPPYVNVGEYHPPTDRQDVFDWKLSQSVFRENKDSNIVLSPLSVKLLLTLLAEAAGQSVTSKTRTELEQVLPYNKSLFDAKEYFQKVLTSLSTKSDDYTVNFGTKMYVDQDVNPIQRFTSIIQYNYLADVEKLNFADERASANSINGWVKTITNGHIKDLVTEESLQNAIVLLVNAMYFEGTWRTPFNKTFTAPFLGSNGKRTDKSFMERTGNHYYFYSKHLNSKILRIPYSGRRYSMFVILPNENQNLDNLVELLSSETIKNEVWHMDEVEVHAVLPKFKFDTSLHLNEAVKKLGIKDIFENTATLPLLARGGPSEGKLKVSNIIQKSGIVVDEKGTTAWSATEIELVNKFGGEPREFVADRPFLFYIEDDTTGAKLFSGVVNNPEY